MNDMAPIIEARSDQLNSDDLIAGPRTITITKVEIRPGTEQPISVFYEGDNGKPWKPCKSMCRVLVYAWGPDASKYAGKSLTLYRDPKVKWGGMEVGGIRISHMSDIDRDMVMVLTATKGKSAPFSVKVLPKASKAKPPATAPEFDPIAWHKDATEFATTHPAATVSKWWADDETMNRRKALFATDRELSEALKATVNGVLEKSEPDA